MIGRTKGVNDGRRLGHNVVEPIHLDADVADIRVGGAVLELVARNRQLHPRER